MTKTITGFLNYSDLESNYAECYLAFDINEDKGTGKAIEIPFNYEERRRWYDADEKLDVELLIKDARENSREHNVIEIVRNQEDEWSEVIPERIIRMSEKLLEGLGEHVIGKEVKGYDDDDGFPLMMQWFDHVAYAERTTSYRKLGKLEDEFIFKFDPMGYAEFYQ